MLTYRQTLSTVIKQKLVLYWMSLRIHLHIDFDALNFTTINFSSIPNRVYAELGYLNPVFKSLRGS